MKKENIMKIKRLAITLLMIFVLAMTSLMTACSKPQEAEEGGLNAADPMTPEEQAADDSGGCIEDSYDLLN